MNRFEFILTQEIKRNRAEVYDFLADPTNLPMWNYNLEDVTKVTAGPMDIGSVYLQTRSADQLHVKIIELIPNEKISTQVQSPEPDQISTFTIESSSAGCKVSYCWSLDLRRYKLLKFVPNGAIKNWLLSFAHRHVTLRFSQQRKKILKNLRHYSKQVQLSYKTAVRVA